MPQFNKHYTREEARAVLPLVKQWLVELGRVRELLREYDGRIKEGLLPGVDLGGEVVDKHLKCFVEARQILLRFKKREILVKDIDRGLIDFPAYLGGKEVFLCWESGEEDIEFWHDLTSGYAGREPL